MRSLAVLSLSVCAVAGAVEPALPPSAIPPSVAYARGPAPAEADSARAGEMFDGARPRDAAPAVAARTVRSAPELRMPASDPDAALWESGFREIYATLKKNLHERRDRPRYARPAPNYKGVYLWDSAFIADVWRLWDPSVAEEVIYSVLLNQKSDGRVPR